MLLRGRAEAPSEDEHEQKRRFVADRCDGPRAAVIEGGRAPTRWASSAATSRSYPERWRKGFEEAGFKDEVKPLILKQNAMRVLGLGSAAT